MYILNQGKGAWVSQAFSIPLSGFINYLFIYLQGFLGWRLDGRWKRRWRRGGWFPPNVVPTLPYAGLHTEIIPSIAIALLSF